MRKWLVITAIIIVLILFGADYFTRGRGRDNLAEVQRQILIEKTFRNEPVDIILVGSDTRGGEDARSDTLIYMHIDFAQERAYLVSIPRDTRTYIPGMGEDKINAAYAYGGTDLASRTVEDFLGVKLDHYVEVDFEGFKETVDALGGIDIDVPEEIDDWSSSYSMHIPKGPQRMDGERALNYVRYRHGDSDFKRTERQQAFLRALAENTVRARTVLKLPKLIDIFNDNVATDMSKDEMMALAIVLREFPEERVESITITGESLVIDGISYVDPDPYFLSDLMKRIESAQPIEPMKS